MTDLAGREIVVVIDDDHAMRLSCEKILLRMGFHVESFDNGALGLDAVTRLKPSLVVVDLKMPGLGGMEVIARVHAIDADIVIVVITGYATIDTAVEAMRNGAYDFLPKPFMPDALRLIVNRGLERRRLALESHRHEQEREMLKRRLVTFVSHQLQTPLVAIHQYLDVLRHVGCEEAVDPQRLEWINRGLRRTEDMQRLIRNWLALSKVESQCLAVRRERVDLKCVISDLLETYGKLASADRITLESRLPEDACCVSGDPDCICALIDNLVTNAIKYNRPGGRVTVSGERFGAEVTIRVSDTGVGIAGDLLPRLFEEFFRVEPTAGDSPPAESGRLKRTGSGLGLPICRRIATELGGSIGVESTLGVGSTFWVRLPACRGVLKDLSATATP